MGVVIETQPSLEEFGAGYPPASFRAQAGLEDAAVMFEDQVDLIDFGSFLSLEAVVECIFAADIAEFLVGAAAEGFSAGLAGMEDRFLCRHHGIICDGKNKMFLNSCWGNFLAAG